MSNSVLMRLLTFALLAGGIWMVVYGGTQLPAYSSFAAPLVFTGAALTLAGLVMAVLLLRDFFRRQDRALLDSPDAIARWQLSSDEVERFRKIDAARAGRLWSLKNRLKLPRNVPPEGITVVVLQKCVGVADRLYHFTMSPFKTLSEVTWNEGDPGFIELSCDLKLSRGSTVDVARIPVPVAARAKAAGAFAYLKAQIAPGRREEMYRKFGIHFEAALQPTDAPHRLAFVNKYVFVGIGAFFVIAFAVIGLGAYFSGRPSEGSVDPAAERVVVACTPEETDRISSFFFLGHLEGDRGQAVERARTSLSTGCMAFFNRVLAAADAGVTIPLLSGYAMYDRSIDTIEVEDTIRCDPTSCVLPTYLLTPPAAERNLIGEK